MVRSSKYVKESLKTHPMSVLLTALSKLKTIDDIFFTYIRVIRDISLHEDSGLALNIWYA